MKNDEKILSNKKVSRLAIQNEINTEFEAIKIGEQEINDDVFLTSCVQNRLPENDYFPSENTSNVGVYTHQNKIVMN